MEDLVKKIIGKYEMGSFGPLYWYITFIGSPNAFISPLNSNGKDTVEIFPYRLEWLVGVSAEQNDGWDWEAQLRDEDAMKIQVRTFCPEETTSTEVAAQLLALHPSRNPPVTA